jgi:hypothetical protein
MLVRQTASLALCLILCMLELTVLANAQGQNSRIGTPHLTPLPPMDDLNPVPRIGLNDPSSPWAPLNSTFLGRGASNPILLTDGTVLIQDEGSRDWWRLTPDLSGSYVNGTWTPIASLPAGYSPLYHSSAVLPDGRLIIEGGEYNFFVPTWTNLGPFTIRSPTPGPQLILPRSLAPVADSTIRPLATPRA